MRRQEGGREAADHACAMRGVRGRGADTDRGAALGGPAGAPAAVGQSQQRRFTEEGEGSGSRSGEGRGPRPKRKFVEEDETEQALLRVAHGAAQAGVGGDAAYEPGADYAPGDASKDKEDDLVMSAWGKKYKAGFVPKSSHVGNLLPADELAKYTTLLPGGKKEEKKEEKDKTVLDASNAGYKMLSKMGWKAGKGLGAKEDGKVAPVGAEKAASDKSGAAAGSAHGVGSQHTWDLDGSEDVYEQYRKRMMLGYRHRPNPNGNPRKLYY